ncbi:MBL fold metallo-hydrolase [Nocardioides rotundus]|uniref:MBL fold metallo-hydrolase n=1 Tax=Nocardioides rotundus TaxID=1774216 RepID=UPI001CBD9390|nr:MBL fold metallo-hydrolase [Nocardioides rotundus]UAL30282.1 MBL fold metallo-hydrolase [Nocardioides rotundus]
MRLTKFGHACIRIEHEGTVLVVDPGVFTEPEAIDGATAVLLTHEHPDHTHPDHLRRSDAPVFTIDAVARKLADEAPDVAERTTTVAPGEQFDAGLPVRAVGELHAVIHPEIPRVTNSGYLIEAGDTRVFHPGDALTGPDEQVDLLCCVVSAPWARASELVDFARAVGAPRNLAIHDKVYSEAGLGIVDGHMELLLGEGQTYTRLADGTDL